MLWRRTSRSSRAPKTLSYSCYRHIVPPGRRHPNRIVAITIVLSFIATLVPIASASVNKSSEMPCCVGQAVGHCDSGIPGAKVPEPEPEPEPTCGHEALPEVNEITMVAEENDEDAQPDSSASISSNQVFTASLNAPCAVDCCTLAWSSVNRSNRDLRGLLVLKADAHPITDHSKLRPSTVLRHASQAFNRATPRGPPSR
jgi:hypothetical protein